VALLEKDRNIIYTEFRRRLGEEATQDLLSQFPARDVDEYVSKEHLDRRLADLRSELRGDMSALSETLTNRMLTIAGIQLVATGTLFAILK
jgi:hypothetical protein